MLVSPMVATAIAVITIRRTRRTMCKDAWSSAHRQLARAPRDAGAASTACSARPRAQCGVRANREMLEIERWINAVAAGRSVEARACLPAGESDRRARGWH